MSKTIVMYVRHMLTAIWINIGSGNDIGVWPPQVITWTHGEFSSRYYVAYTG